LDSEELEEVLESILGAVLDTVADSVEGLQLRRMVSSVTVTVEFSEKFSELLPDGQTTVEVLYTE
jgi:hypothetical protein